MKNNRKAKTKSALLKIKTFLSDVQSLFAFPTCQTFLHKCNNVTFGLVWITRLLQTSVRVKVTKRKHRKGTPPPHLSACVWVNKTGKRSHVSLLKDYWKYFFSVHWSPFPFFCILISSFPSFPKTILLACNKGHVSCFSFAISFQLFCFFQTKC